MKVLSNIRSRFSELKDRPVWRVLLNKYFIVTLIFLLVICFFDQNNLIVWTKTRIKLRAQQSRIEFYEKGIRETEEKINQLHSEKDSLEKFAREEFFFHESGEDIYIVE